MNELRAPLLESDILQRMDIEQRRDFKIDLGYFALEIMTFQVWIGKAYVINQLLDLVSNKAMIRSAADDLIRARNGN
jgi:hypothetical protein